MAHSQAFTRTPEYDKIKHVNDEVQIKSCTDRVFLLTWHCASIHGAQTARTSSFRARKRSGCFT